MGYRSLKQCMLDLEASGQLLRIPFEVDPHLEMAEIHRRIFDAAGPAIYFEKVKGSPFPALSNLYGTYERTRFIFRHTIENVSRIIALKADPSQAIKRPARYGKALYHTINGLPRRSRNAPVLYQKTRIDQLPGIISWPMDGGAFITLPQVITFPPGKKDIMKSNVGMYRIQLTGNEYITNEEVGLHYQLHRGIGIHHTGYLNSDEPFRTTIAVGGPPANAFAAIMPLPEGLSELTFAGLLNGHRFPYHFREGHFIANEADFCITGIIRKEGLKPEGPFGDHLGYYSLTHDFPVMQVQDVWHRKDAIWHFTVVGRPPQEDSYFGKLIHDLVGALLPSEFPGITDVHAVDASGVHPLLLAIGTERYMPFRDPVPEEILTQANHLLGKGQTSLAKFLIIANSLDDHGLNTHDIPAFFNHVLHRVRWERDLHFHTQTTIDTLDYSGSGWNTGSKVVIACRGPKCRTLGTIIPEAHIADGWDKKVLLSPGIICLSGKKWENQSLAEREIQELTLSLSGYDWQSFPLIILQDDAAFAGANWHNFLWTTFTRANPATDIHGVGAFVEHKHWGCTGPLIIDARIKSHHAPALVSDPMVSKKVDGYMQKLGKW